MVNRSYKRSSRVGPVIREVVCEYFVKKVRDPKLKGVVITEVEVSPDLRNCVIYYQISHGEAEIAVIQETLDKMTGKFRKELSTHSSARYVPKLKFKYDQHMEDARRIDDLLSKLETSGEA